MKTSIDLHGTLSVHVTEYMGMAVDMIGVLKRDIGMKSTTVAGSSLKS